MLRDTFLNQPVSIKWAYVFLEEIGRVYRITISRIIEWRVLSFFFPLGKYRAIFIPKYFDFHIKVDTRHPFLSRLNVRKVISVFAYF